MIQERLDLQVQLDQQEPQEQKARPDLLDLPVQLERLEQKVQQVLLDQPDQLVRPEQKARLDQLDLPDLRGQLDLRGQDCWQLHCSVRQQSLMLNLL